MYFIAKVPLGTVSDQHHGCGKPSRAFKLNMVQSSEYDDQDYNSSTFPTPLKQLFVFKH